ncbi:MAG TPA: dihydropteroate synthase [Edaphobacter sp.]|nr:dihydropteroate synthase [Edaphobacter sp.]
MSFAPRPRYEWKLRTRSLHLGVRTLVMGILNVTPDSFSDGGHFFTPQDAPRRAVDHAMTMLDEGADVIDLGGESTRPGATPITADEEQQRVLPVLEEILRERPSTIVSIDTFHASTARLAIEAGAEIVNDVSGHQWDSAMASTCARLACGVVLMHTRGRPSEWRSLPPLEDDEVVPLVLTGLEANVAAAENAGIVQSRIVIDPGFGFGKRMGENYPLLADLSALHRLRMPVLVGVSRKSFLTQALRRDSETGGPGSGDVHATTAANVAGILAGTHILRVHDVRPAVEAARVADRILLRNQTSRPDSTP